MDAKKPSRRSPTRSSAARPRAGESDAAPAPPARRAPAARPAPSRPAAALDAAGLLARADRDELPATLYVEGPSESLKAAMLAELRAAWAAHVPQAPGARVLRAAESGVEEILAAYQGASLFAPRELTVVLGVEVLGRSPNKVGAFAAGLGRPNGGSCLVLVESEAEDARKSLDPLRAAVSARWIADVPDRRALLAWGARRMARERIDAERGVLEAVAETCEGDALAFFNELEKLCVWAGEDRVLRLADARAMQRPAVDSDLPDYLSAVALGHSGPATIRLARLLLAGVSEGEIMFGLSNMLGGALGGWTRFRPQSAVIGRRLRPAELTEAVDTLYRAEAAWKSGRADVHAVLELATRALCRTR